jgi:FtsP/CotA-like multicopper oxidase with cupredoxin domain
MLTRRRFSQMTAMTAGYGWLSARAQAVAPSAADFKLEIATLVIEPSPKHRIKTVAYNGQVPGPLLRLTEGRTVAVEVRNHSVDPEIVHWHGLFLPPEIDGAMEEGTPMIQPGAVARYTFAPEPAGFRWYHTHTFAGNDLRKAQYGGQHGFLLIEPREHAGAYDQEVFLALHDWEGQMNPSSDGSAMPSYDVTTINGKMLGYGEPVRVKEGERVVIHVLNSSPTEVHWVSFSGHTMQVIALDGNTLGQPRTVEMLRLAPAERVSVLVEMKNPGVWVFGEVRKHVQATGMGIVFEYAGAAGKAKWIQPQELVWEYAMFASGGQGAASQAAEDATAIHLTFSSKFEGHGSEEKWLINGKSYPDTEEPVLESGKRYRLVMENQSMDDHPMHLHRHRFEVKRVAGSAALSGLMKDVVLVPSKTTAEVEFVANHPGRTLFHCHQQDHMDRGFMMVFRYA